jgi:hypothetical protein
MHTFVSTRGTNVHYNSDGSGNVYFNRDGEVPSIIDCADILQFAEHFKSRQEEFERDRVYPHRLNPVTFEDILESLKSISPTHIFKIMEAQEDPACDVVRARGAKRAFKRAVGVEIKEDGKSVLVKTPELYDEIMETLITQMRENQHKFTSVEELPTAGGKKITIPTMKYEVTASFLIHLIESCMKEESVSCIEYFIADL